MSKLLKRSLVVLLALVMVLSVVACTGNQNPVETTAGETPDTTDAPTEEVTTPEDVVDEHTYDFYVTLGTMPTLYATLNAYARQNPNTYMWFLRGNTISREYSADFIHYFDTQSETNANSTVDWSVIRNKVKEINDRHCVPLK